MNDSAGLYDGEDDHGALSTSCVIGGMNRGTVSAPTLEGHLEITASRATSGRSFISRQSFRVPCHISKPYWDGQMLRVQAVNPTAGLFPGDSVHWDVKVDPGARLCMTTPSANRIYAGRDGLAEVTQRLAVASGATLVFTPAMLIPHRESRYRQTTRIDVERGGTLLYRDILAPGRVAHSESFEFDEIVVMTDMYFDSRLNLRERIHLQRGNQSLVPLRSAFPAAYYASWILVTDQLDDSHLYWNQITDLQSESLWIGASRLSQAGWNIKLMARDSLSLHKAVVSVEASLLKIIVPRDPLGQS